MQRRYAFEVSNDQDIFKAHRLHETAEVICLGEAEEADGGVDGGGQDEDAEPDAT